MEQRSADRCSCACGGGVGARPRLRLREVLGDVQGGDAAKGGITTFRVGDLGDVLDGGVEVVKIVETIRD